MTVVNEMPLTVAAVATYGVGRLARSHTIADVGLHWSEALISTTLVAEVMAEVIRVGLGRERPRANPDNAFSFDPGAGLTAFEHRAFPSLHAAVAFATAASLTEEIALRRPTAARYVAPVLYGAALVPGFTRVYLDRTGPATSWLGASPAICSGSAWFNTRTAIARSSIASCWDRTCESFRCIGA
jgi:membrane-associated phospholipid phosphatase